MKIRTIDPINNVPNPEDFLHPLTTILYGQLTEGLWDAKDFNKLTVVGYYYFIDNGNEVIVKHFSRPMLRSEINALEASLTIEGENKCDREQDTFNKAFKILMSQTYNVDINNIEIIN